jgi:hypothetical protein
MGATVSPMVAGRPGLFDRGPALIVKLASGNLSSVQRTSLLNGSNTMLIGDGSQDNWEVFQFQNAVIVGENTYELSGRLRRQAGSDGLMPSVWPAGSRVILMTPSVQQVSLQSALRGVERHYRVGSAARGYDDGDASHHVLAFQGNGLRPFRVSHLRTSLTANGDRAVSWIRRTRIDGDSWNAYEVPLGEGSERYQVIVKSTSGQVLSTTIVTTADFIYTAAQQSADGVAPPFAIEVAQISDRYGPGPASRTDIAT